MKEKGDRVRLAHILEFAEMISEWLSRVSRESFFVNKQLLKVNVSATNKPAEALNTFLSLIASLIIAPAIVFNYFLVF